MEAGARSRAVEGGVAGDWVCRDCSILNFSFRRECKKCGKAKWEGQAGWRCAVCSCDNPARREECGRCQQSRSVAELDNPAGPSGAAAANSEAGATWQCAACFHNNFPQRTECHVCKHPRPQPRPSTATTLSSEHGPGPPPPSTSSSAAVPAGDWRCANCAFNNYARRSECHRCQLPRGVAAASSRMGSWKCPNPYCAFDNFPYRRECHHCRTPQPVAAAAPSMMYGAAGHWQGADMGMSQAGMMPDMAGWGPGVSYSMANQPMQFASYGQQPFDHSMQVQQQQQQQQPVLQQAQPASQQQQHSQPQQTLRIQEGTITPENVLEQLMADGTFDSLRLTVTSLLKSNVDLQRFTTDAVLNSNVLRHRKELESMTREELFAKLRRELEAPVMRCASKHVWDILTKPNQGPVADQIEEAVYRAAGLRRTMSQHVSNASPAVPSLSLGLANGHDMGQYSPVSPGQIGDETPDLAKVEEKVNEAVAEASEALRANKDSMVIQAGNVSLDAYADTETPMEP